MKTSKSDEPEILQAIKDFYDSLAFDFHEAYHNEGKIDYKIFYKTATKFLPPITDNFYSVLFAKMSPYTTSLGDIITYNPPNFYINNKRMNYNIPIPYIPIHM